MEFFRVLAAIFREFAEAEAWWNAVEEYRIEDGEIALI